MLNGVVRAERFDVVVVGAGPAGSACALALTRRGARVALVERRPAPETRLGESLRGIAAAALRELGVWEDFCALEPQASYVHRSVWGGRCDERAAIASPFGPDLHLDRAAFDGLLIEHAVARGATLFRPAAACAVDVGQDGVTLSIVADHDRLAICAPAAIDATGPAATVARRFGAARRRVDRLMGVARSFDREGREPFTLVESANEGWWYSAPQPGKRLIALFVTDADSPAAAARRPETWPAYLASAPATCALLAGAQNSSPARTYSAAPGVLDWDPRSRLLPAGDAALSFDPISADGLCFALRSGIDAAAALLGERGSKAAYRAGIHALFLRHLERREMIYGAEREVRPTPFWLRRRGAPGLAARALARPS